MLVAFFYLNPLTDFIPLKSMAQKQLQQGEESYQCAAKWFREAGRVLITAGLLLPFLKYSHFQGLVCQ